MCFKYILKSFNIYILAEFSARKYTVPLLPLFYKLRPFLRKVSSRPKLRVTSSKSSHGDLSLGRGLTGGRLCLGGYGEKFRPKPSLDLWLGDPPCRVSLKGEKEACLSVSIEAIDGRWRKSQGEYSTSPLLSSPHLSNNDAASIVPWKIVKLFASLSPLLLFLSLSLTRKPRKTFSKVLQRWFSSLCFLLLKQ